MGVAARLHDCRVGHSYPLAFNLGSKKTITDKPDVGAGWRHARLGHLHPFQRQGLRQGIGRRRDESVKGIEGRGIFRQGMHQESADTKNRACGLGALNGIAKQSDTEARSLPGLINSQAPQDRHRNGVRHVPADAPRRLAQRQRARGQAAIADTDPSADTM